MASSIKSSRDGGAVGRSVSLSGKSRLPSGGVMLGAGLAGVVVLGAALLSLGVFAPRPAATLLDGTDRSQIEAGLVPGAGSTAGKADRGVPQAVADDRDAAHERMLAALAATEDPSIAVLPGQLTLASVDKSTRPMRESVVGDARAMAILKEALGEAAEERTARLALAAELDKQNLRLSRETRLLASAQPSDKITTGGLPAAAVMAYAPVGSAADTMIDAEEPFEQMLNGIDEAEAGLIEDIPVPSARPELPDVAPTPAPAKKLVPGTAKPSKLALAKPDNPMVEEDDKRPSLFGRKATLPKAGSRIAVYDISAGVVYMPNGEKLEAHSGRGSYRDNPKYVHVRNRGSTPPNVYKLRMREARFHGVEAIRMLPVGDSKMYGRDGFLTHSYLLRVPGDSSGCVVFPQYNRFLNAFKRGQVATLIVVPRMAELPRYLAML